jgi:hypothetical protein
MDIITIDMETYYDKKEFSLSSMQTDAYVLDHRFEVIGVGIKHNDHKSHWFTGDAVAGALAKVPWDEVAVLAQNTAFDAFILAQKYGIKPKLWLDTLSMARALYPWLPSHSLKALAQHCGVGVKGTEVDDADGKRLADFTPAELAQYGEYCKNDCDLEKAIYDIMAPHFPPLEFALVDMTIRMFTEPAFQLDAPKIVAYRDDIIASKAKLLDAGGVMLETIMSNNKFAAELEKRGVVPPTKISKTTGKEAYAFSKTDKGLTDLLEDEDSEVQALVAARLGNKTTIAETRAQKLIETAERGVGFPVFLNYWGAKTTGRYSGGNKVNAQNLPNRGKDRVLREAMVAPEGYCVVVGDSSNIELRVNMVLSGQDDLIEKIRTYDAQGDAATSDLYCDFATELFGRTIGKGDKLERTVGKIAELSLGYQAGAVAFMNMLRVQAKINYDQERCQEIVDLYRSTHDKVTKLARHCGQQVLQNIANENVLNSVDVNGWFLTTKHGFALPGHLGVVYHDLRRNNEGEWEYQQGRQRVKIYAGKVLENLCQHAARQIVMWQTARVNRKYPVKLSVHDEIVCVVPEEQGEACAAYILECLQLAPAWCRGAIPLNGEVGIGKTYASAK